MGLFDVFRQTKKAEKSDELNFPSISSLNKLKVPIDSEPEFSFDNIGDRAIEALIELMVERSVLIVQNRLYVIRDLVPKDYAALIKLEFILLNLLIKRYSSSEEKANRIWARIAKPAIKKILEDETGAYFNRTVDEFESVKEESERLNSQVKIPIPMAFHALWMCCNAAFKFDQDTKTIFEEEMHFGLYFYKKLLDEVIGRAKKHPLESGAKDNFIAERKEVEIAKYLFVRIKAIGDSRLYVLPGYQMKQPWGLIHAESIILFICLFAKFDDLKQLYSSWRRITKMVEFVLSADGNNSDDVNQANISHWEEQLQIFNGKDLGGSQASSVALVDGFVFAYGLSVDEASELVGKSSLAKDAGNLQVDLMNILEIF